MTNMKRFFTRIFYVFNKRELRGFTLVEALFVVLILALIMTTMVPFARTVHSSWEIMQRRTELQQNARVAFDIAGRLIREAKRFVAVPSSGSGDFIEMRNSQDSETIILFHNIPSSPYYMGASGFIADTDLVMRTIDSGGSSSDVLLAKSLNSLIFVCRNAAGAVTSSLNNIYYIDISMTLEDSQGLTQDFFSSFAIRSEVHMKPVWVGERNNVAELSSDMWISGFSSPLGVSVDSNTGDCWVADTGNGRIKKISSDGVLLVDRSGFSSPASVSADPDTGEAWVANTSNSRIVRLSSNGTILGNFSGFNRPQGVSFDTVSNVCWVADTRDNSVKKINSGGNVLVDRSGFSRPASVSVNTDTGECWVADTNNNRIIKLSSGGIVLVTVTGANRPASVSVNPNTGDCWVADTRNNRIARLASNGQPLLVLGGFRSPDYVSVDTEDNSCWVADTGNDEVVKVDQDGNERFRISGFNSPESVTCKP